MKRIGRFLRSVFSHSFIARSEKEEEKKARSRREKDKKARSKREESCESVSLSEEERVLALQVRHEVEDGRMFLRPGLALADVAAKMNQEVGTIERVFARCLGDDFSLYVDELRIAYVAVLYMGSEAHLYSIEKIGVQCGFPDHFTFCETCLRLTGMTPEMMGEFIRSRKTLKGVFLNQPIYLSAE